MVLSRKFRRFSIFFTILYILYYILTTTIESHNLAKLKEQQDDKFLMNTQEPIRGPPKQFDQQPVPIQEYHHNDIVFVEQDLADTKDSKDDTEQHGHGHDVDVDNSHDHTKSDKLHNDPTSFYQDLFDIYMSHFPQLSPIRRREDKEQLKAVNINDDEGPILSESYLADHLSIDDRQFNTLKSTHRSLLENIKPLQPPLGLYEGDGIVINGDGENLVSSVLVVKMIREVLKSDIDIEIMIYKEKEPLCEVLNELNATCSYIYQNFNPKVMKVWNFNPNLYKSLLILNSHFANVLYLDTSTFPLEDPALMFKESLFKDYGMVLWPDYWRRMTSPLYYKIIDKTLDTFRTRLSRNEFIKSQDTDSFFDKIPLHDRGGTVPDGTTLGEIVLIDKFKHFQTLLLSLYYNINGDDFFYPLLTNFAQDLGGGEKETLLTLLNCLDLKFYQVTRNCDVVGSWFNDNFNGVGVKQYNLIRDYRNLITYQRNRGDFMQTIKTNNELSFISINNPKLQPLTLSKSFNGLKELDGNRIRLLGEDLMDIGTDLELYNFEIFKHVICELKIDMAFINDRKQLCKFINLHLTFLKSTSKDVKLPMGPKLE